MNYFYGTPRGVIPGPLSLSGYAASSGACCSSCAQKALGLSPSHSDFLNDAANLVVLAGAAYAFMRFCVKR